jgi:hypothetical protein
VLRHILLAAATVIAVAGSVSAQEWADKMVETKTHDFGSVARASKCVVSFPIKNLYKEDVHISGLEVSCSCTSAEITKKDLKTFETAEVVATFNTRAFTGHKGATIKVIIDKPYFAEIRLRVDGDIRTDVVFDPPQVDLGNVDVGSTVEKHVQVRFAGRSDWEIKDITSNNKNFEVSMSKPTRTGNRTDYELTVRLKNDASPGYIKDVLTLVTNDSATQRIPLYVEGRVVPALTVSPASLYFGTLKPGQTATKLMIVQGKSPFKITEINCEDQSFKFKTDDTAAAVHRVPVTFTAPEKAGKLTQNIVVKTDAGSATGTCQAWAMIEPAPQTAATTTPVKTSP